MNYTNSPLTDFVRLSPHHSGHRTHSIDRITPHCAVSQCSAESLGSLYAGTRKEASANYGIGRDGRIGLYVEEKNRSWCSSSESNDQRAVTIECASDNKEPYAFRDIVYQTLITLCTDICKRNGKKKLLWLEDREKTLSYTPAPDEMVLTVHRWFSAKSCPGSWMFARMGDLAAAVTAELAGRSALLQSSGAPSGNTVCRYFRVRKEWSDITSQKGSYKYPGNARKCADANPGYHVFDPDGNAIYTSSFPKSEF